MDHQGGSAQKGVAQIDGGTEWWCVACGFGFKIGKSRKVYLAEFLLRQDAKARVGKPSDNVEPDNLEAYVRFLGEL